MHACDHKRYVDDMLIWLHQAISIEKENILISIKDSNKTDQKFTNDNNSFNKLLYTINRNIYSGYTWSN